MSSPPELAARGSSDTVIDPIERLARDDKWQLGAGEPTIFAPVFPQWLDVPGFWDEATLFDRGLAPLFTVTVLDDEGRELAARAGARRWTPAELILQYRLGRGITATEVRTVQPGGIFVSEWRFAAYRPARIHLVAWTAQDGASVERGTAAFTGALAFTCAVAGVGSAPLRVLAELACVGGAASWCAARAERRASLPDWRQTPFAERWHGALPGTLPDECAPLDGGFFAAVHRAVEVEYAGAAATFAMRLVPADAGLRSSPPRHAAALRQGTLGGASRRRWGEYFGSLPHFRCSDPYFETAYWYRWFGLRLHAAAGASGNWKHAAMCEGPGELHRPAALAAPAQVRELRWLGDPSAARDALLACLTHQQRDGSVPSCIGFSEIEGAVSHADWGAAILALDALWPDDEFARKLHVKLAKFAAWLVRARDADGSGLFDVGADADCAEVRAKAPALGRATRLKGVDVTVFAYDLFRALELLAPRVGAPDPESSHWMELAERTRDALLRNMWDAERQIFSDVDASTGVQTGVKTALCFLPYRTDLVDAGHVAGLERHLLNPAEFWTAFPVPTVAVDERLFSAEGVWGGSRRDRPWNGRSWPAVTSQLVDALAHTARTHASHLRAPAATLLRRFVRMTFHDGELQRANCHEHYNPLTGHASVHRGMDDVQNSWVNDLILRHVMGILPHDGGLTIDPLPFGLEQAEVRGVRARGRLLDVAIAGDRFTVRVDGTSVEGVIGVPLELHGAARTESEEGQLTPV